MIFDIERCGGCRTCEIACSYHHGGIFKPSISSIKIVDKKQGPGFFVELMETGDEMRMPCDGCEGMEVPHCVEVCEEKEELKKAIDEFMKQHTRVSDKRS